jgi:hypothetical protein
MRRKPNAPQVHQNKVRASLGIPLVPVATEEVQDGKKAKVEG